MLLICILHRHLMHTYMGYICSELHAWCHACLLAWAHKCHANYDTAWLHHALSHGHAVNEGKRPSQPVRCRWLGAWVKALNWPDSMHWLGSAGCKAKPVHWCASANSIRGLWWWCTHWQVRQHASIQHLAYICRASMYMWKTVFMHAVRIMPWPAMHAYHVISRQAPS